LEVATVNLQPMRNVPVTFMAGAGAEVVAAAEVVEEEPVVTARGVAARPQKVETKAAVKGSAKVPAKAAVRPEVKMPVKAAVKPAGGGVRSVRTAADQRKRDQQTILKGN
jgi:hypothetical protein